ncbi:MAG: Crp/Fnr family transcriptional regulator [Candidatus Sericytochromatia bacterium]|nr:Crp/Fnr family transcriptional regulator [Candidatus Sericytochromatia bacterium]
MAVTVNKKLDIESKIVFLRRVPIFGGVDEDNLTKIANITSEKNYSKKNIVFHEGDYGDALYIIKNGRIKIAKVALDGREKTLTILKGGDFFGEMAIFDDMPRSATAESMENDVKLLSINKTDFERLITENPSIAIRIMKDLTRRIRQVNEQVQDLAFKDVHGRVASTLYNLLRTEKDASKEQNKDQINSLKMTHQDLANMVGSSRETVTRALNRLQDEGVISISHQQISVLDLDKLSESQD